MNGFKQFLLRGNVVDLAVGVVVGAAFGTVVTAFVKDLLTPLIAAVVKKPDFSGFALEINGSKFLYGDFVNALISFVLVAAAVYYFVVLPINALVNRLESSCAGRSNDAQVSGMPERNFPGGKALRVLHVGSCTAGSKRSGLAPELLVD